MKKLLSTVIIVAVVGFVAFKASVWWFADRDLKQVRIELETLGVVERGSIHSSVAGQLTLQAPSYQHFQLTQPLNAASLTYDAGSAWALLASLIDPEKLPASWQLSAEGLQLTLDANMFRSWVSDAGNPEPALFAPVCGPDRRQRLGSGDLLRLGIGELRGDALLRQRASGLHLELHTEGTGSLEVNWPGVRFNMNRPAELLDVTSEPLTLTVRDGGTMRKIAAYCSRELGVTGSEWSALVLEAFEQQLARQGFEPSPQLMALYRRWLSEGGELTVALTPGLPLFGVPVRAQAGGSDSLTVSYNGATVPDVYLSPAQPVVVAPPPEALEPLVPEALPADVSGWREQDLAGVGRWQGHTVRVTLRTGRVVEGRLVGADERQLEVARLVDGGEVVYPMTLPAVTRFEVWQRGRGATAN